MKLETIKQEDLPFDEYFLDIWSEFKDNNLYRVLDDNKSDSNNFKDFF